MIEFIYMCKIKKITYLILLFSILFSVNMEASGRFYYVQLKDKNNSPYALSRPTEFLSEKAIARREKFNIAIDSTDLPVNPQYIQSIASLGVTVHSCSKWMNGITVLSKDSISMEAVKSLSFVDSVQYTGKEGESISPQFVRQLNDTIIYGSTVNQIDQIKANALHNAGYFGKDIEIAVIDAGFRNADLNIAFDSLRLNNQLIDSYNVIYPDSNVYVAHEHGANVLSIMSGNLPGKYLGIAPKAKYRLILSEYSPTEYLCEVDFWTRAVEYADSAGVDLVNSSLGYAYFDDPNMDFTYSDMNGKVCRASRAAEMAASKGIVICVSAGNEALKTWKYIGSPADANHILTVGAVNSQGSPSTFSSFGPSSDGRTKPDLSAWGTGTSYVNYNGLVTNGNGTSYSSPVLTGAMACVLDYMKSSNLVISIDELLEIVRSNSSHYSNPGLQIGYGIPDFGKTLSDLQLLNSLRTSSNPKKPFFRIRDGYLFLLNEMNNSTTNDFYIYDMQGRIVLQTRENKTDISLLNPGLYIIRSTASNLNSKFFIHK